MINNIIPIFWLEFLIFRVSRNLLQVEHNLVTGSKYFNFIPNAYFKLAFQYVIKFLPRVGG